MKLKIFAVPGLVMTTTGLFVAPTAAQAQNAPGSGGNIEQIVVTAQRRAELQVDVPITVATIRAQWTDPNDRFTIAIFGDNITNNRYKTQVQYANSGIGSNWAKPVTYGAELGVKF